MHPPRVLFHIANYPACNEMFAIIDHMLDTVNLDVSVFVDNAKISEYVSEKFSGKKINIIDYYGRKKKNNTVSRHGYSSDTEIVPFGKRWGNRLRKRVLALYAMPMFEWHRQRKLSALIQKRIEHCQSLIERVDPVCLVVRGDRHLGNHWEGALLKVCGEKHIKRVIVPIATASTESLIKMRRENDELIVKKRSTLFAQLQQQIIFDPETGRHLLYKKAYILKAMKEAGVLPANPWVMGGGNSDLLLVEGDASYDRYKEEGTSPEKMCITGHGSNDKLYHVYTHRQALRQEKNALYSFDEKQKIIIISLPQLAEHKIMGWEHHWQEIRFLCKTLQKVKANILISLHPRMDPQKYQFISQEYGLRIATERLVEILPIADIFLSCFSSTIEWAVLCGIPTVAFDFYNFNYTLYAGTNSLLVVKEKTDFLQLLEKLVMEREFYQEVQRDTEKESGKFGRLDGHCLDRIVEHIV